MGANASIVEARAIKMARVEGDALIFMVHCLFLFCVWSKYADVDVESVDRMDPSAAMAGGCQHFRLSSIPC